VHNTNFIGSIVGPSDQSLIAEEAKRLSLEVIAGEVLSALKLIYIDSNNIAYLADFNIALENAKAIGITVTAGPIGATVKVVMFGVVRDAFFSFPSNSTLYLGSNGEITDIAPVANVGYYLSVGQGLGAGAIFINIGKPIQQ